jgi:macrolide-specific efflux system membrane fusion protein
MNKSFFLLIGALSGALGCLGADPNVNSQVFLGAGGSGTGTGGSGTGGSGTGTGGSGTASGMIKGTPVAVFASGVEGFQLNNYHDTGQKNLADAMAPANPAPVLSFDSGVGNPDNGSIKVTATYSGPNQYVDVQSKSMMSSPQNWSGRTLHVRIKVDTGNFGGGAQLYVLTTSGFVFGGTHTNFAKNSNWQEFTTNLDAPVTQNSGFDATQVIVFGVQLTSDATGVTGDVTFHVDSFSVDPPLAGSTGAGGAGGGAGGAGGAAGTTGSGGAGGTSSDASAGG